MNNAKVIRYLKNDPIDGQSLVSAFSKNSALDSSRSPGRDRFSLKKLKNRKNDGSPFLGLSDLGSNSALLDTTFQN
jgi:hypothetical protein